MIEKAEEGWRLYHVQLVRNEKQAFKLHFPNFYNHETVFAQISSTCFMEDHFGNSTLKFFPGFVCNSYLVDLFLISEYNLFTPLHFSSTG